MTAEKCFSHGNDDGMGWVARVKNGFLGREIDIGENALRSKMPRT